ncbi:hypothetical protein CRENBAI_019700 [Crenichthys baileyi]|uniref:Uncharacterized protein n=1 Tax=Crenichthys baileyi TaxID=28760 RepID=A0AAV9QVX4_9TELE
MHLKLQDTSSEGVSVPCFKDSDTFSFICANFDFIQQLNVTNDDHKRKMFSRFLQGDPAKYTRNKEILDFPHSCITYVKYVSNLYQICAKLQTKCIKRRLPSLLTCLQTEDSLFCFLCI